MEQLKNFLAIVGFFMIVILLAILIARSDLLGLAPAPVAPPVNVIDVPTVAPQSVPVLVPQVDVAGTNLANQVHAQQTLMAIPTSTSLPPTLSPTLRRICVNTVAFSEPVVDSSKTAAILPKDFVIEIETYSSNRSWAKIDTHGSGIQMWVPMEHLCME